MVRGRLIQIYLPIEHSKRFDKISHSRGKLNAKVESYPDDQLADDHRGGRLTRSFRDARPVAADPLHFSDDLVVRVYFDDLQTAYEIAASFEPMESNYEKGYLILTLSRTDYHRLLSTGLCIEVDDLLTTQMREAKPVVSSLRPVPASSRFQVSRVIAPSRRPTAAHRPSSPAIPTSPLGPMSATPGRSPSRWVATTCKC